MNSKKNKRHLWRSAMNGERRLWRRPWRTANNWRTASHLVTILFIIHYALLIPSSCTIEPPLHFPDD